MDGEDLNCEQAIKDETKYVVDRYLYACTLKPSMRMTKQIVGLIFSLKGQLRNHEKYIFMKVRDIHIIQ